MATKRYKRLFAIRFTGYFVAILGALAIIFEFGPILGTEIAFRSDQFLGIKHSLSATVINSGGVVQPSSSPGTTGFNQASTSNTDSITPVSTDFGIVIEKIDANAKVIPDIDPANQAQYTQALAEGVAEAKGSTPPGQPGNLYIFSHSTDAPWNVIRYNAVFYLLRELVAGDRVVLFYQGRRFDYTVYDKTIVDPNDITLLTNRYDKPVLTLQTCDPPGTLLHRLIVRAKLVNS